MTLLSRRQALWLYAVVPIFAGGLHAASVTITPGYVNVGVNQTVQYHAAVTGLTNTAVTWKINNVTGGNSQIGTITQSGLYTAPAAVPTVSTLVEALASDNKTMGAVYVNVAPAGPVITSVSPNPANVGNGTFTISGSGFVSGAGVMVNGATMSGVVLVNSNTLKVSSWVGSAGQVPFQVQNPGTLWGPVFDVTFVNGGPPPATTISPKSANVNLGATQQFTSNNATSWNATAGTISTAGLYTAPATMPSSSKVTVTATGPGGSATATVTLIAPPPQTISPTTAMVNLGATQQFTSAGATNWSATAGTVSGAGLYTAPATMPAQNTVTVTATGPGGSASATVTLVNPNVQTISPLTATVALGGTQQFSAPNATGWSATAGTVSTAGLFTAPATMPASNSVTVTATGPGGSAAATVTLTYPPQTIAPLTATVALSGTQQFTAPNATSWTATAGTVSTAGLYTAPAAMPASSTVTVTALGPGGTASATVTLLPPGPVITGVGANPLPLGLFSTTVNGTGFTATSAASLNGSPLTTTYSAGALTVSGFAAQSGSQNLTVANGSQTSPPFAVQVGNPSAVASAAAARRFLERAAFGPSPNDAANVQALGMQAWLNQQFTGPQVSNYNAEASSSQGGMPQQFLANAVTNPDQLRQRVAFALSQIFVTSIQKLIWNGNMVTYQNMLLSDAFTNYRQIMEDVTLSSAMGQYLDMANNAKAVPGTDAVANENYARELMQLFSIGTQMLNQDGSVQLDNSGTPIPTYSQFTVTEFARVFTGWTYAPAPGGAVQWGAYINGYGLAPVAAYHDSVVSPGAPAGATGPSKYLLAASPVGSQPPTSLTPQQDLDNALDNIFNHPNAGPFVARLLIQHLVKSNPSPAYISRVAAAFNGTNGAPRGDMKNVITAILLDPEATANDEGGNDQAFDGHLQEPALFVAGIFRAFGGTMTTQNYFSWDLVNQEQDIFNPPSVFNYFSPTYHVAGVRQNGVLMTNLIGPEFQIFSPSNALWRANMVQGLFGSYSNPVLNYGPGTNIDLTPLVSLAATPATLVNALDLTLTHGVMPAAMKTAITNAVASNGSGNLSRVEQASYLILTSNYYNVWH